MLLTGTWLFNAGSVLESLFCNGLKFWFCALCVTLFSAICQIFYFQLQILTEVVKQWPGKIVIIRGRPKHPATQGLVEKGNDTAKNMIAKFRHGYSKDNPKSKWSYWLPTVQCKCMSFVSSVNLGHKNLKKNKNKKTP